MTTARLHGLDTVLIIFPEFDWPSDNFVDDYAAHVEGIVSLAVHGVSVEMAQETLRWLVGRPRIALPPDLSLPNVNAVVEKVARRKQGTDEMIAVSGTVLECRAEE